MSNPNGPETQKTTEEIHYKESCGIVNTETTENGARKFVRTCSCSQKNLLSKEFYHHSKLCNCFWRKCYQGYIINMICWCGGPHNSVYR